MIPHWVVPVLHVKSWRTRENLSVERYTDGTRIYSQRSTLNRLLREDSAADSLDAVLVSFSTPKSLPDVRDVSPILCGMLRILLALVAAVATLSAPASAQAPAGDWRLHNFDAESSRFSPLDQINTTNAEKLAIKWQADLPKPSSAGTATPIVVGGIMYLNSGQTLFAIDGATGKTLWTQTATQEFPGGGRGPAFGDGRIYAAGRSMIAAFDAETGRPIENFGTRGVLNP